MSSKFRHLENKSVNGVIHVGAHRGEEVLDYKNLGASTVIWIEANPDVFTEMQQALSANPVLTSMLYCVAASDVDDEEVDFHICYGPDAGYMVGNKGCSSLLEPVGWMAGWKKETIKCQTITLDTLLFRNNINVSAFNLLNMDVQGAEMLVLKGATGLLNSKDLKYVTSEVTFKNPDYAGGELFPAIEKYLSLFKFRHVETVMQHPNWGDALFVRE